MKKLLLIFFLLTSTCFADIPINEFVDKTISGEQTTLNVYAYPKYYTNNGVLEIVDTSIIVSQDVGWDFEVKKGVYKLRIKNDGTFEVNHLGDVYSLKFLGLGFFNSDTKQRITPAQTQVTLSSPIVSGNSITWSLAGGSTYQIIYDNDTLRDILTVGNTAKNFLKNNKPNGWTADNTWVGLIYDIDLLGSSMIEGIDLETDGEIAFIQNGRIKHRIRKTNARSTNYQAPKIDSNGNIINPVESSLSWPRRRIIKNGKYVEAIKATALDVLDNGNLVFNTDVTFQEGVNGYVGMLDTRMEGQDAATNFETSHLTQGTYATTYEYASLMKWDLSSISSSATVTSSTITLTAYSNDGNTTYDLNRFIKRLG